jgi:hypothetical protein
METRLLARRVFVVGVWLVVASVLLQFLLAGLGIFANPALLVWHATVNGSVVALLPLLLVGVGLAGRVPARTLWLTAAVPGLVIVQSLLLLPYRLDLPAPLRAIAGLHVLNALLIFWVALGLLEKARSLAPDLEPHHSV